MLGLAGAGFAFAGGIALAHYVLPQGLRAPAACVLLAMTVIAVLALRGEKRRNAALICFFAMLGTGWYTLYSARYLGAAADYAETTQTVTVRVDEYAYRDGDYASLNVTLAEPGEPRLGIAIADYDGALPEFRPGDLVSMELEFSDASMRYGETTDVYAAKDVHLRAYYLGCGDVHRDWKSALYFPQELLRAMDESIRAVFPEDVRAIMLALLIGETHEVYDDYELDNALATTGLSHVISVSGMHLSFLWAAVVMLAGRRRASLIGIPLIIVFTLMMGCSSAIVRACVMLLLSMLAFMFRREPDPLTSMSFALMILLAANPMSIASVSLQLSFASMLGLVLVSPKIYEALKARFNRKCMRARKLRATAIASVSSSVGATVFTLPIVATLFGYVSLISPVENLLTLWAVSAAFTVGFAAAVAGTLWTALGTVLAWIAAWPARLFVFIIELLAKVPYAAVYTADRMVVWWLIFTYVVFILAVLRAKRGADGKKRVRLLTPAICCSVLLVTVLFAARQDTLRERSVTVLDVGQGQSVALLSGESAVVVDCGGGGSWEQAGDVAGEFLLSRGRHRIDALVLTHLHSDHANGAAGLMSKVDVGTLYMPENADDSDGELEAILETAASRGTQVVTLSSEDMHIELDGMGLVLLAPRGDSDENERGLVVKASIGEYDTLITGDAGFAIERTLAAEQSIGRCELLVAGHHGSRYSNSFELVDCVRPETVIVSVGYNSYGHPTEEALSRLAITGAEIYRTDLNGNVTVRIDDNAEEAIQ